MFPVRDLAVIHDGNKRKKLDFQFLHMDEQGEVNPEDSIFHKLNKVYHLRRQAGAPLLSHFLPLAPRTSSSDARYRLHSSFLLYFHLGRRAFRRRASIKLAGGLDQARGCQSLRFWREGLTNS